MTNSHGSRRSQRPTALAVGLLLASALCGREAAAQEADRRYTVITGTGQSLYRIAVPPGLNGGGAQAAAKTLSDVLSRDLTLIGLFKLINPKAFLANLTKEGTGIDTEPWVNVGAQGVIKCQASATGGGLVATFYLYDVAKGTSPVLKRSYRGGSSTGAVRRLAHRFGDEVVKFYTGERGVFTTRIAFTSANPRKKISNVYVMDYDGYGVHRVSKTGNQNVLPAWSPSGALVWTSYLWRNPDLYFWTGGRPKRISKRPGLNTGAAFSPSGKSIALTLSKDGNAELYLISPGGAIQRRLTRNSAIDASPTWSPDGGRIAFVSNRGGSPQIYVMSASGGGARRLTFQGNYNQEPDWCPNPKTPLVAFTGRDEAGNFDIFTVNVASGEVKRLTQGQGSNTSPSWAPNGKLLVFHSSRGGLWLMNPDGLNQHKVHGGGVSPSWSR